MTGRCETDTIKIKVEDSEIFLHIDRWKHSAPTFWWSAPTKFRDSHIGKLLELTFEEINGALR